MVVELVLGIVLSTTATIICVSYTISKVFTKEDDKTKSHSYRKINKNSETDCIDKNETSFSDGTSPSSDTKIEKSGKDQVIIKRKNGNVEHPTIVIEKKEANLETGVAISKSRNRSSESAHTSSQSPENRKNYSGNEIVNLDKKEQHFRSTHTTSSSKESKNSREKVHVSHKEEEFARKSLVPRSPRERKKSKEDEISKISLAPRSPPRERKKSREEVSTSSKENDISKNSLALCSTRERKKSKEEVSTSAKEDEISKTLLAPRLPRERKKSREELRKEDEAVGNDTAPYSQNERKISSSPKSPKERKKSREELNMSDKGDGKSRNTSAPQSLNSPKERKKSSEMHKKEYEKNHSNLIKTSLMVPVADNPTHISPRIRRASMAVNATLTDTVHGNKVELSPVLPRRAHITLHPGDVENSSMQSNYAYARRIHTRRTSLAVYQQSQAAKRNRATSMPEITEQDSSLPSREKERKKRHSVGNPRT